MALDLVPMLFRLMPTGPQKDAAEQLAEAIQADPQATEAIKSYVYELTPLADQVNAGDLDASSGLAQWLLGYRRVVVSDVVRSHIDVVLGAIAADPLKVDSALKPALKTLGYMLPRR